VASTWSAPSRRPAARRHRFWNYPRPNKGPIQRWLPSWRIVVGCFLAVAALGAGTFVAAYATTDIPEGLNSVNDQTTTVYYSDGKTPIGVLSTEKRVKVDFADLPPYVGNAVVASEDSTFWTNNGIDPKGIIRAAVNNLKGGSRQGASTLTQQYVERYYTDTTTSYAGKAQEAIIALKIARSQDKEVVLGNYLNTIYWGRGANGVEAASQAYFGHSAKKLTYSEAAMLAGIIPSPSRWDPGVNEDQAKARWARSISRMKDQGYITADEANKAKFPKVLPKKTGKNTKGGQAGYLLNEVEKELKKTDQFSGQREGELYTGGLNIVTTIDKKLQKAAVDSAKEAWEGDRPASKNLQVAVVSMDPTTGELRALYGGKDYVKNSFNFATEGAAQGGSTFKPYTLIGALEGGHKLNERFDGSTPKVFPKANNGGPWTVDNFAGESFRNVDLTTATANSVNTVYAKLNIDDGPEKTVEVAHRLGIPDPMDKKAPGYRADLEDEQRQKLPGFIQANNANVLGTAIVRPVDVATAYSTIAGGGYRVTPHIVREIKRLDGSLVYTAPTDRSKVVDPDVISAATYAMTQVVERGSGSTAKELGTPVAGKTGTSQKNKSAWFAGFVPNLVTVVGLHQEQSKDDHTEVSLSPFGQWSNAQITGGTFPVRAWTDFMEVALDLYPDLAQDFPPYSPPPPLPSPSASPSVSPSASPTPPTDPQADWVDVPPNLVGRQLPQVQAWLDRHGLRANPVPQASNERKGTVLEVGQAGQRVPPGSTLKVVVSTGPDQGPPQPTDQPSTEPPPDGEPTPDPTATDPGSGTDPTDGTGPGNGGGGGGGGAG
jgi:membrane peptidoglycan carboxypeptidase